MHAESIIITVTMAMVYIHTAPKETSTLISQHILIIYR